jgi:hypothetical membrane protein
MSLGDTPPAGADAWLALAGLASPIVLATAMFVIAAGRPDYSHLRQTISELGSVGRPGARWMNLAGVVPAGLLLLLSVPAVHSVFGPGRLSAAGAFSLALAGACLMGTGLSPWAGAPGDFSAFSSKLHTVLAVLGFLALPLVPLLFGVHAGRVPALHAWHLPSLIAGGAILVLGFMPIPAYLGAFQRAALTSFFLWLTAVSLSALRVPRV